MTSESNRRKFLGTAAGAAAFTLVPRHALGARSHSSWFGAATVDALLLPSETPAAPYRGRPPPIGAHMGTGDIGAARARAGHIARDEGKSGP